MRIQAKLIIALLIATTSLFGAMYFLMQWSFDRGLLEYVNQRELQRQESLLKNLQIFYQQQGSWQILQSERHLWGEILEASRTGESIAGRDLNSFSDRRRLDPFGRKPPPPREPPDRRFRDNERPKGPNRPPPRRDGPRGGGPGPTLLDKDKSVVIGRFNDDFIVEPIVINGDTIGWLAIPPQNRITDQNDLAFREKQNEAYLIVSLIMITIALFVAIPLARHFIKPIQKLAQATGELTQGNYDVSLDTRGKDELGQLARDFKDLAATLSNNETARKRWIADISHELRTPLAIARGEVEAQLDGVRPMSKENLVSIQQEIEHLQKLINDLYELTNAEVGALRYQKEEIDLNELAQTAVKRHQSEFNRKKFTVESQFVDEEASIWADPTRLNQLLDNLLNNACKYADDGATLKVASHIQNNQVILDIQDSGPGVPDAAIEKLFDHLFRVDDSRNRQTGGSGLGLAICKKIVEAHDGEISAQHSPQGGLWISIAFPML